MPKTMKKLPFITLAVLTCNSLNRLKKVVNSYLMQNYPHMEIVVVDNGSTDGSIEFLEKFKKIRLIKNKSNLGYQKGKNILVRASKGEYILMLDDDIKLTRKDFITHIYNEYLKLEKPGFLSTLVNHAGTDSVTTLGLFYNRTQRSIKLKDIYNKGILKIPGFHGNIIFFKKETFIKLNGFDEIYPFSINDYDLSARAYLAGYNNYLTTKLYVLHYGMSARSNLENLAWRKQFVFCGFSRTIWKCYTLPNIILWWPISSIWIFYKSLKSSISHRSLRPLLAYFKSVYFFIRDFSNTIEMRKRLQSRRLIKKDVFLSIKKFDFVKNK